MATKDLITSALITAGLVLAVANAPTWVFVLAFALAPLPQIRWTR